ncbi:MAG: hypothetical protein QM811_09330 [Pirellulales bacterium]
MNADPTRTMRYGVYTLLILLSIGQLSGKLAAVDSVDVGSAEKAAREDLRNELKSVAVAAADENRPEACAL